ncbi:MAG: hypothetical protein H8E44_06425 [Planctomycetes bacterium]|nr:hypothetical protein [Planctomycetota bacterium]MBL7039354.1 hypothetical protein [Pirellulaceae bacterium]
MDTQSFLEEMNALKDRPDAQDIENVPAVLEANRLAWNASTRSQGIKALAQLVQQFPASGNICALYMQALAWDNRVDEALGLASERLDHVTMKSEIASGAGVINLQLGRLREAVLWFLRSAAAQGGGHIENEHLALELSVIFRAVGTRSSNSSLLAASNELDRIVAGRIRHSNEGKLSHLASQADEELVSLMVGAAQQLGWIPK